MSKSKRCRNRKKPLKVVFSLQERESHQKLGKITDYEVKTFMHEGNEPRRCTSLLAPRSLRFEKSGSESEEFPEKTEQRQFKPSESSCKATEKSEKSSFNQSGLSSSHPRFVSSKCTTSSIPRSRLASGKSCQFSETSKNTFQSHAKSIPRSRLASGKSCQFSETYKNTFQSHAKSIPRSPSASSGKSGKISEPSRNTFQSHAKSIPRSRSASGKSGQFSQTSKNTFQNHAKRTNSPGKAAEKSGNAAGQKRKNVARKGSPSPTLRNRIIGGGSRAPSPCSGSSKFRDLSLARLTKTLCTVAGKPENQLENCAKPMQESVKSTCSDTRSARRGSFVSFHEPVAAEIPYCDPPLRKGPCSEPDHHIPQRETPKPAFRKWPCSKTHRPLAETTCEHKPPKNQKKPKVTFYGKYKRPVIVVPLGEQGPVGHSNSEHDHRSQNLSNTKLTSYIPYKRRSLNHVDSLNNIHVNRTGCQHRDPCTSCTDVSHSVPLNNSHVHHTGCHHRDPCTSCTAASHSVPQCAPKATPRTSSTDVTHSVHQCGTKATPRTSSTDVTHSVHQCAPKATPPTSCTDVTHSVHQCAPKATSCAGCTDVSHQIRQLVHKINSLEATVLQMSEKHQKPECPKLERKLSTCDHCQGRNLPILKCFKKELIEAIGPRSCTDVVISIFLRADNIYHVNLRDLKTGHSIACFLVTDDAIMAVQRSGLFKEILTFCVIDVRNTLKPKNCALGITFELVDPDRQKGGCDTVNRELCMTCKPFLARVLGQPLHRLRHVYTDPAITSAYIKKSLKEKFTRTKASLA